MATEATRAHLDSTETRNLSRKILHLHDRMAFDVDIGCLRVDTVCVYYDNNEPVSYIQNKNNYQRIYVQFVDHKKLAVHESFTDSAEIEEMLGSNASESGEEQTNLKECIIYTKEPLLMIFREPLQQNEIMRVIKKTLVMNCLDQQQVSDRQYIIRDRPREKTKATLERHNTSGKQIGTSKINQPQEEKN